MIYQKFYTKTRANKFSNFLNPETDENKELLPVIQVFEINKPNFVIVGRNLWRVDLVHEPVDREGHLKKLGEARLESQAGEEQEWLMPIPQPLILARSILARGYGWRNEKIVARPLPYEGSSKIFKAVEQDQTARFLSINFRQPEYVSRLQISLLGIVEDNRCPMGVVCTEGGFRAKFLLRLGSESERVILGTNSEDYYFAGFTIKIFGVEPPKVSEIKLESTDYRIDLYVCRGGG